VKNPGPLGFPTPFDAFWSRFGSSRHLRADLALLAVTLVWGSTFVLMQESVRVLPPYRFLALRFGLASLVMLALYGGRLWRAPRRQAAIAAGIGATLFVGYASQTIGLQFTTAARSGFVTGLAVVLVPVIGLILLRQRPPLGAVAGVALATAGLFFLSWPGWEGTSAIVLRGDLITLVCSVAFAVQIVLVGKYAPAMDPMALTTAQLLAVALLSGLFSLGEAPSVASDVPPWLWAGIVFLGVAATALAFAVQSKAQRFTTPTHVALIFAMEPVFSAIFAWLFTGEVLTGRSLVGSLLILSGMIVAEARSS
jgi:drug/metabolite transporter (DMT)-like permease